MSRPTFNRLKAVFGAVAEYYGYDLDQMRGKHKTQSIVQARHLAMYLSWPHAIKSDIAAFSHRDHASVIHGIRNAENRIEQGDIGEKELEVVRKLVNQYIEKFAPIKI